MKQPSRYFIFILLFALALIVGLTVFENPEDATIPLPLAEGASVRILKEQQLTEFDTILELANQEGSFIPYDLDGPQTSNEIFASCWLQIPLHNRTSTPMDAALEVDYRWVDIADLYAVHADGSYTKYRNGASVAFSEKTLPFYTHAFPIQLQPGEQTTYYLYLRDFYWLQPTVTLWETNESYIDQAQSEQRSVFIYLGLLLGLIVMNLCVYLAFREKDTLYYLMFLLSVTLLHIIHFNLHIPILERGFQAENPLLPAGVNFYFYSGILIISAGLLLRFAIEFLQIHQLSNTLYRIVKTIATGLILIAPVFLFGPATRIGHSVTAIVISIWAMSNLIALGLGIYSAYRKTPQAYFFVPAILLLFIVSWQYNVTLIGGGFPNSELLKEWLYASGIEMIVLAVALSERLRSVNHQNETAQQLAFDAAESRSQLQASYNQQLEKDVASRTHELEAASNQKSELLRIIAHDIKAPIDGVSSLARMLAQAPEGSNPEKIREYTKDIQGSAAQLSELTKTLLLWGQLQAGHHSTEWQPYLLTDLKDAITPNLQMLAKKKDIELKWSLPPYCFAQFDFESIASVLRNLISNAIKYSPAGETVTIGATMKEAKIEVFVQDKGTGIAAPTLERIQQNLPVESTKGVEGEPGTGIGLQICYDLLKSHATRLQIKSHAGEGTYCSFQLQAWEEDPS